MLAQNTITKTTYKRKYLVGFMASEGWSLWWQSKGHGSRKSWKFTVWSPNRRQRELTGNDQTFEPQNPSPMTLSSNKAMPLDPSQTVLPTSDNVFKHKDLWGPSHSNTAVDVLASLESSCKCLLPGNVTMKYCFLPMFPLLSTMHFSKLLLL